MEEYLDLAKLVITSKRSGFKFDRTKTGTISCFGPELSFDLSDGFPALTTKRLYFKSIFHELIWFLNGSTNVKYLKDNGVRIWNEWADKDGELGPVYGHQWRSWDDYYNRGPIDQVQNAVDSIKKDPMSRRHIVSAWNVAQIDSMALPPCHMLYQFNVQERNGEMQLDLKLTQRSADLFLGVPFNIASYAALDELMAHETGLKPGYLIISFGDAHIYLGGPERSAFYQKNYKEIKGKMNEVKKIEDYFVIKSDLEKMLDKEGLGGENSGDHLPLLLEQMSRKPYPLPKLLINPSAGVNNIKYEDFTIEGYNSHPEIKGKVAV